MTKIWTWLITAKEEENNSIIGKFAYSLIPFVPFAISFWLMSVRCKVTKCNLLILITVSYDVR